MNEVARFLSDPRRDLALIERKRREMGVTKVALERAARLSSNYYERLLRSQSPSRQTLGALKLAIGQLKVQPGQEVSERVKLLAMILRTAIAFVCEVHGVDAAKVQMQRPQHKATQNPEWREGADMRRMAIWLVNSALGLSGADIARAVGVSRAAIHQALHDIEDRRDDQAFADRLDRLEKAIQGEWWNG